MQGPASSTQCVVCGRQDTGLRCVEFMRARRSLVERVDSQVMTVCRRHRMVRGATLAGRALLLDVFNVGLVSMLGNAFENIRGGRVVPGDTSTMMADLAPILERGGKEADAAEARALSARYAKQMDSEIAAAERAALDAERRRGF
jgi:hypothetical protein